MYPLPEQSILGQLSIIEIYLHYDRPVFFACRNNSNTLFLALFVQETKTEEIWLYAPMSPTRFAHVRSGGLEIRRAFSKAEDNLVYQIAFPFDNDVSAIVNHLIAETIPDTWLPASNEFLSLSTPTLLPFTETTTQKAQQSKREVVNLIFDFIGRTRTEASAKVLGNALVSFQELLNTIGAALKGSEATKGAIPISVITNTEMLVNGIGSGSFKVELIAAQLADLFDTSEVGKVLEKALDLVSRQDNVKELHTQIEQLNTRVATKYLSFLKIIDDEVNRTIIDWGSPDPTKSRSVELTSTGIKQTIKYIEQTEDVDVLETRMRCQLIGANIEDRKFEIKILSTKQNIEGKVMEEAYAIFSNATLSAYYIVTIRETTRTKVMTGEIIREHALLSMFPSSVDASI